MCEFCTVHGEGKKWYLEMKNYAEILLHEELSASQQEIVDAKTRRDWNHDFFGRFVMPAVGAVSSAVRGESEGGAAPKRQLSEEDVIARRKVRHFGQVLPINVML